MYYAKHYKVVYSVINELDGEDASSIAIPQDTFQTPNDVTTLKPDLAFISANLCFLLHCITNLEKSKQLLTEITKEINNTKNKPNKISDSNAKEVREEFLSCLNKNKRLQVMHKVSDRAGPGKEKNA